MQICLNYFISKKNWIFQVDGDEIFDEKRLLILKDNS